MQASYNITLGVMNKTYHLVHHFFLLAINKNYSEPLYTSIYLLYGGVLFTKERVQKIERKSCIINHRW
ncbi:hypothetical protein SAFG77S_10606 [Streptomyces afghaniensis]